MASYGDEVLGVTCPKCHRYPVVYNGNYFCENFEVCGWAMSENSRGRVRVRDNEIVRTYLNQRRTEALAAGKAEEVQRMEFYLQGL